VVVVQCHGLGELAIALGRFVLELERVHQKLGD
jgi:hypothetical protein